MDFFISYNSTDAKWAEWIAWELEAAGYQCVIQAWDIKPGQDFMQQMRTAMSKTKQTIAVLSPAYLQSEFGTAELNSALVSDPLGNKGKLLPVRVKECELTDLLRARVYVDLIGKKEEAAKRELIEGVRASRLLVRKKPVDAVRFPVQPSFPGNNGAKVKKLVPSQQIALSRQSFSRQAPLKFLFLASDAGIALNLKGELVMIKAAIKKSSFAESVTIVSKFDVTAEDLFQVLNKHKPHIFHFSGTLYNGKILLSSKHGGVKFADESALVGLLRQFKDYIRLVVLNACDSLNCAEAISKVIDYAIGVRGKITDEAAIKFAEAFYRAIGFGLSVTDAYEQGLLALKFDGASKNALPELRLRNGTNRDEKILFMKASQDEVCEASSEV